MMMGVGAQMVVVLYDSFPPSTWGTDMMLMVIAHLKIRSRKMELLSYDDLKRPRTF